MKAIYLILFMVIFSCSDTNDTPTTSLEKQLKRASIFEKTESWKELEHVLTMIATDHPEWVDSSQVIHFSKLIDSVNNIHPIEKYRKSINERIGHNEIVGAWRIRNVHSPDIDYRLEIYKIIEDDYTNKRVAVMCLKNTKKYSDIIFKDAYFNGGEFIYLRDSPEKEFYWIKEDGQLVMADSDGVIDSNLGYIVETIEWNSIR